jgi:predicted PurR-regulated permease PerM
MSKSYKYFLVTAGFIVLLVILWYFRTVIGYILISAVLSLLGKPVVRLLRKIRLGKARFPVSLCAAVTLLLLLAFFFCFFWIFIPLIVQQGSELSSIDIRSVLNSLEEPLNKVQTFFSKFVFKSKEEFSFEQYITNKMEHILNVSILTGLLNDLLNITGDVFVALFAISFITFFFLREEKMFLNGILMFVPDKNEDRVRSVVASIEELLIRYFASLGIRIVGVLILTTTGLIIVGLRPDTALVIGLFNGIINIVPYVGPIIGGAFGLIIGLSANIQLGFTEAIGPLVIYMLLVFSVVQVADNLFAPLLLSGSVKAHPLEIFLIILIAGSIFGIGGMILAIPVYTIMRVIAKEFLYQFKLVRKITKNI